MIKTYDYVIVGGGTAGCLLANRLSVGNCRVLLLEAGGSGRGNLWIKIPIGYLYTMGSPKTDWCYVLAVNPHLGGRRLNYPRGRVLGGSSAINGMIYMRGQSQDYDNWVRQGCVGWSWREVLPYFIRHENNESLAGELHGQQGEVRVSQVRSRWPVLDAFAQAANVCGIPHTEDFNGGDNFGVGYFQVNQKNGVRQTAADAFLRPLSERPNVTILTGAQIRKVILEKQQVVGVEYQDANGVQSVHAGREVILSAGSIGSPHILQNSGIGAPVHLQNAGIETAHPLSGVGENLQDHLQIRVAFRVQGTRTLNESSHSIVHKIGMGLEYALLRRGPLSSAPSQLGCFARSGNDIQTPDLQYHVQPLSLDAFGKPLHDFPGFTASVCDLRPRSRGFVRAVSSNPLAPPIIDACHLSAAEDRMAAARAVRHARMLCLAKPLARFRPQEIAPGNSTEESDEALAAAAGRISTTIFHPCGTCKMGAADDETAVVDARLRVRGIGGLRVADASVMPNITSGNTNAPTLMIAEKAAAMILEDA